MPVIGGIFLVVLLLDADVDEVLSGSVSDVVGAVFASLRANPAAMAAFALAFLVVLIGGSVLTFIVKAGTVAVFVDADAGARAPSSGRRCGCKCCAAPIGPESSRSSMAASVWDAVTSGSGWCSSLIYGADGSRLPRAARRQLRSSPTTSA